MKHRKSKKANENYSKKKKRKHNWWKESCTITELGSLDPYAECLTSVRTEFDVPFQHSTAC